MDRHQEIAFDQQTSLIEFKLESSDSLLLANSFKNEKRSSIKRISATTFWKEGKSWTSYETTPRERRQEGRIWTLAVITCNKKNLQITMQQFKAIHVVQCSLVLWQGQELLLCISQWINHWIVLQFQNRLLRKFIYIFYLYFFMNLFIFKIL